MSRSKKRRLAIWSFSDGASEIGKRSIGIEDYSLTIDLNAQLQPKLAQIDWNSCIPPTVVQIGEHICTSGFIAYAKHSQ
jgi:hypothetical protein